MNGSPVALASTEPVAASVQAMQDAHRHLYGGGRQAQLCVPLQIVEEWLQQLVEDLGGGVHRMQVADT